MHYYKKVIINVLLLFLSLDPEMCSVKEYSKLIHL